MSRSGDESRTEPLLYGALSGDASHPQQQQHAPSSSSHHAPSPYLSMSAGAQAAAGAGPAGAPNAGFDSSVLAPPEAKLFSLEVTNGQGGPHAKSWAWMSRDQVCIGVARYPVLSLCSRVLHFLWLFFFCGCVREGRAGWRDGLAHRDDDEEDEQEREAVQSQQGGDDEHGANSAAAADQVRAPQPPRLRTEASLLVFTSRVDYVSLEAFKAPKERLRYSLPIVRTSWRSIDSWMRLGCNLIKSSTNWLFGPEFGWVMVALVFSCVVLWYASRAAGLYGNPDYFAGAAYAVMGLFVFALVATVYHIENRAVWQAEQPKLRAAKTQLARWAPVLLLWLLVLVFLAMAVISGWIFLHRQDNYGHTAGERVEWTKHENLMCDSWDDHLGIVRPYIVPTAPAQPTPTPTGPPPAPLQLVSVASDTTSISLMFLAPAASTTFPILGFNGTAFGSDGSTSTSTQTLPPSPMFPPITPLPTVGIQFLGLTNGVNYRLSVSVQNSQGYSTWSTWTGSSSGAANEWVQARYRCSAASGVNSCAAPPTPSLASVVPGSPGSNEAFVSVVPGPYVTSSGGVAQVTPAVLYYSIYLNGGLVSYVAAQQFEAGLTPGTTGSQGPAQTILVSGLPADSWQGLSVVATNLVGSSATSGSSWVRVAAAPTGHENMCSRVQRASLITFLFSMACATLLLVILAFLTFVRRARRRYATVTFHGKHQWGLPASVLLDLADARTIETLFTNHSRGQYDLASAGYPHQQRINNKLD